MKFRVWMIAFLIAWCVFFVTGCNRNKDAGGSQQSVAKNTVESLKKQGFEFSHTGKTLIKAPKDCTSCDIPEGVTTIDKGAFENCKRLQSVTIPSSVTVIGDNAFRWCTSLKSVTIPSGVTKIGDSAFWECTSLQKVEIAEGVIEIGDCAFSNCISLESVFIPLTVKKIHRGAFYGCPCDAEVHRKFSNIY